MRDSEQQLLCGFFKEFKGNGYYLVVVKYRISVCQEWSEYLGEKVDYRHGSLMD